MAKEIKSPAAIKLHKAACKICNLPPKHRDHVNDMLLKDCADSEVERYGDKVGIPISCANVYNHRKFLPYLIDDEKVAEMVRKAQEIQTGERADIITNMEKKVVLMKQAVNQAQDELKVAMWGETIPAIVERIEKEAQDGVVPVRDLAYALDLVMKNALLLAGGVTSRVEVKNREGDRPDDVAALTSSIKATLAAISRANEAINEEPSEEGTCETVSD